ncbi:MAG: NAD-dependent epimerase/dehydratase family protein [Gammaproteobacteria bacterium]|nr:NAD-dependent epimerase/dehydratase family protein [Gammaproteobacteria bacterium]
MRILVTGAGGLVGGLLADRCESAGLAVVRSGRRERGGEWLTWDMSTEPLPLKGRIDCVMHTAPLWVLTDHVEFFASRGVTRLICFSSTSVLTKRESASRAERALAASLDRAESGIHEISARHGVATTVLRPTMIYGYGRDANVSAIARYIRRYGFFAVAGGGEGKRQPVHADDLAGAAMAVLGESRTIGRTYNLGGGETLAYRSMVERIFHALDKPVRIVKVPAGLYRTILAVVGVVRADVTASMADRMSRDLVFDSTDARTDFGFAPQGFLMYPDRDLPAA